MSYTYVYKPQVLQAVKQMALAILGGAAPCQGMETE